jgi:hypothetical protein
MKNKNQTIGRENMNLLVRLAEQLSTEDLLEQGWDEKEIERIRQAQLNFYSRYKPLSDKISQGQLYEIQNWNRVLNTRDLVASYVCPVRTMLEANLVRRMSEGEKEEDLTKKVRLGTNYWAMIPSSKLLDRVFVPEKWREHATPRQMDLFRSDDEINSDIRYNGEKDRISQIKPSRVTELYRTFFDNGFYGRPSPDWEFLLKNPEAFDEFQLIKLQSRYGSPESTDRLDKFLGGKLNLVLNNSEDVGFDREKYKREGYRKGDFVPVPEKDCRSYAIVLARYYADILKSRYSPKPLIKPELIRS